MFWEYVLFLPREKMQKKTQFALKNFSHPLNFFDFFCHLASISSLRQQRDTMKEEC